VKAAEAKAEKLRAKGKEVDFEQLLREQADRGVTNIRNLKLGYRSSSGVDLRGHSQ